MTTTLSGADQQAQTLTIDELGGDEVMTVGLPNLVDGEDVRVIERGRRPGFLPESAQAFFILCLFPRKELERHAAA